MLPYGRKNPLPFLYSLSSPITTVPSKGKGEIYKRVENRRLSTLLCARAASAHISFASQAAAMRLYIIGIGEEKNT